MKTPKFIPGINFNNSENKRKVKYYIDTEFIERFHKPLFGKARHVIDLISIAIVREDGEHYYAISNEYRYKDADDWVKENVILPLYQQTVSGDSRNYFDVTDFHLRFGKSNRRIAEDILRFTGCYRDQHFYRAPLGVEFWGYYADYDWVLFCSLFGRMINLPKGFPMYCNDLIQLYKHSPFADIKTSDFHPQQNEHNALADANWNKALHEKLINALNEKK